ncbi:complex I subunit 5 family protein [Ectothiorhodospira mobilis]|uniref:complex I subunit 5 family protein n=1 Tax=Ectothiorhodospira mobilis TaxID=195064 RepID=UPI0019033A51|nr:proton-conducting transporter membrane subunit [Ectothiorhodospira mobilis]MBK1692935.1 oxidoreductase [Ectothiorhodospira mobilis]
MEGMSDGLTWAAWLLIVPLAGALLAGVWPRAGRWIALATSVLVALLALGAAAQVWTQGPQVVSLGGWVPPLGIGLRLDGLAAFMLLVAALVGLFVGGYSLGYIPRDGHGERFWALWLWLWAALNALFLSGDVFNLYVTLELVVLASTALVALSGGAAALLAAMRYLMVGLLGSMAYLMGVALLYTQHGVLDLGLLAQRGGEGTAMMLAATLMSVGLMAKAALFPLHVWLPPAHGSAPAPASALLSALVVKGAFYILLRLWLTVFQDLAHPGVMQLLGGMGMLAVFWGGFMSLSADRLKPLVAYSTVAQVGYLFLAFPFLLAGPGGWHAAVFLVAAHATAKACLFMAAGNLQEANGGDDRLASVAEVMRARPLTSFALGIAGASLVGLPFTVGFVAKWILLQTAITSGAAFWAVGVVAGGLLTGAYVFRLLGPAFRPGPGRSGRPVPVLREGVTLALALVCVLLGFAGSAGLRLIAATPVAGPGG